MVLAMSIVLGLVVSRYVGLRRNPHCDPIPNKIAVCMNGQVVSWTSSVEVRDSKYYAPLEELTSTLGTQSEISPDKSRIMINGKKLSTTNGSSITDERDGKVYVSISDAANAAGFAVAINFTTHTVNILK